MVLRFRSSHLNVTRALAKFGIGPLVQRVHGQNAARVIDQHLLQIGVAETLAAQPGRKFREQITGKHRFYEPHRPSIGHLAKAQSRRETLDAELAPESDGSQMLPLRLRL